MHVPDNSLIHLMITLYSLQVDACEATRRARLRERGS